MGNTGPRGEMGPMGPIGPHGEMGPQGEMGPRGEMGQQGEMGPRGEMGPQGEMGPMGPRGEIGPIGPRGEIGPIGPRGEMGPIGPRGEIGPMGPPGPNGLTGALGPKGDRGDTGPVGPKGDTGQLSYEQKRAIDSCVSLSNMIKPDSSGIINFAAPVRFYTDVNFDKNANVIFNGTGVGGSIRVNNRGLAIKANDNIRIPGGTIALMDSNGNIRWNSRSIINGSPKKTWPTSYDPF